MPTPCWPSWCKTVQRPPRRRSGHQPPALAIQGSGRRSLPFPDQDGSAPWRGFSMFGPPLPGPFFCPSPFFFRKMVVINNQRILLVACDNQNPQKETESMDPGPLRALSRELVRELGMLSQQCGSWP